jgi:hypothetical protein
VLVGDRSLRPHRPFLSHPFPILPAMRIDELPCPTCDDGLAHCHGTLVRHADGSVECLDSPSCDGDPVVHDFVVTCAETGCGCEGASVAVVEALAA